VLENKNLNEIISNCAISTRGYGNIKFLYHQKIKIWNGRKFKILQKAIREIEYLSLSSIDIIS